MSNLQIAQIIPTTQAEGPGIRFALWLQGCPLRCPGCCNPEMLKFEGGTETPVESLCQQVNAAKDRYGIEGITLMGGEPFSQPDSAAKLANFAQQLDLSVMIFTGHLIEELRQSDQAGVAKLLAATDLLIDGPYQRENPDTTRRWIGSTNQRIHFLTDRYSMDDKFWRETDTLEVRLADGELTVNGFPATSATGLWKRPKPKR